MKYIFFNIVCSLFIISCDLEIQEPYEFKPEATKLVTFKEITALQYIETKLTPAGSAASGDNFDSLYRAIKLTGLESEFNGSDPKRTFLLLNNTAWVGTTAGKILRDIGNVKDMTAIPVDKLRTLLRYHIVTEYIHQIETTKNHLDFYYFQTLVPGDSGLMSVERDERYTLTFNNGARLPAATRKSATAFRHNYQFKNGIAHMMNTYIRNIAF
jgi:hypothetical protein